MRIYKSVFDGTQITRIWRIKTDKTILTKGKMKESKEIQIIAQIANTFRSRVRNRFVLSIISVKQKLYFTLHYDLIPQCENQYWLKHR
jgi:hypothetical protein